MSDRVRNVDLVSDGIIVEFGDGLHCYFPASFLYRHVLTGSNQVFLDYDPSAEFGCESVDAKAGMGRSDERVGPRLA